MIISQCSGCEHFHRHRTGATACNAYPEWIPVELVLNEADHTTPYPGDHGIRFSPLPAPAPIVTTPVVAERLDFNPYHDPAGRFSTATEAVESGAVPSPIGDENIRSVSGAGKSERTVSGVPMTDKEVVLVFGGTYNPVHSGHVSTAEDAKRLMEARGYRVKTVVMAPSGDSLSKAKGGELALSVDERTALLHSALEEHPGLSASAGPGHDADAYVGKLRRTQLADWAATKYPGTTVVNVTGEDQAVGSPKSFPSLYMGDVGTSHDGYWYLALPRDMGESGISSSKIRAAVLAGKEPPEHFTPKRVLEQYRGMLRKRGLLKEHADADESSDEFAALVDAHLDFDPEQPRDERGRWASAGASGSANPRAITETSEFKEWFKASKVLDGEGRPLLMFHGTNADVDSFRPFQHFGTAKAANDRYRTLRDFSVDVVGRDPGAFSVMPVYLSIKNPLRLPDLATVDVMSGLPMDEARARLKERGIEPDDHDSEDRVRPGSWETEGDLATILTQIGKMEEGEYVDHYQFADTAETLQYLKDRGYDGIVYKNEIEDPGKDSWIAFDPSQVKSAFNRGKFSASPGILDTAHADFDPEQPRHPAGTPGGVGGRFVEAGGGVPGAAPSESGLTEPPAHPVPWTPDGNMPHSIGIPRGELPQVKASLVPEFLAEMEQKGVKVERGTAKVKDLLPTQASIHIEHAKEMLAAVPEAALKKPVVVSNDNHILDGHHRWAALYMLSPEEEMQTVRVDLPIGALIAEARAFSRVSYKDSADAVARERVPRAADLRSIAETLGGGTPEYRWPRLDREDSALEQRLVIWRRADAALTDALQAGDVLLAGGPALGRLAADEVLDAPGFGLCRVALPAGTIAKRDGQQVTVPAGSRFRVGCKVQVGDARGLNLTYVGTDEQTATGGAGGASLLWADGETAVFRNGVRLDYSPDQPRDHGRFARVQGAAAPPPPAPEEEPLSAWAENTGARNWGSFEDEDPQGRTILLDLKRRQLAYEKGGGTPGLRVDALEHQGDPPDQKKARAIIGGFGGMGEFVMEFGKETPLPTKPPPIALGTPKLCYENAAKLVLGQPDRFVYSEGFILSTHMGLPIQHAWAVDRKSGSVVDPTLGFVKDARYYGVRLTSTELASELVHNKVWGVLSAEDGGPSRYVRKRMKHDEEALSDEVWLWTSPPGRPVPEHLLAALAESVRADYSPDQPREPAGSSEGGRFASAPHGGPSARGAVAALAATSPGAATMPPAFAAEPPPRAQVAQIVRNKEEHSAHEESSAVAVPADLPAAFSPGPITVTQDDLVREQKPEQQAEFNRLNTETQRLVDAGQEFHKLYSDGKGNYIPERKVLHNAILKELLLDRVDGFRPPPGQQPTLILLGGRGGSGKSQFKTPDEGAQLGVYDPKKVLVLDADAIKEMLPGYDPRFAYLAHEESKDVMDMITRRARAMGVNLVLDITMKSLGTPLTALKDFRAAGYRVEAHYMHVPAVQAARRSLQRWIGADGKMRGRLVPPEVVLSNTKNEENFKLVAAQCDAWSAWDNNVPRGTRPRLLGPRPSKRADFDPEQPRDEHGRWAEGSGGSLRGPAEPEGGGSGRGGGPKTRWAGLLPGPGEPPTSESRRSGGSVERDVRSLARIPMLAAERPRSRAFVDRFGGAEKYLVHPNTEPGQGFWRVTVLNGEGMPFGHAPAETYEQVLAVAHKYGADLAAEMRIDSIEAVLAKLIPPAFTKV